MNIFAHPGDVLVATVGQPDPDHHKNIAPPRSTSGGAKRERAVSLSHALHIGMRSLRYCVHCVSLKITFTVVSTSTGFPFSR